MGDLASVLQLFSYWITGHPSTLGEMGDLARFFNLSHRYWITGHPPMLGEMGDLARFLQLISYWITGHTPTLG